MIKTKPEEIARERQKIVDYLVANKLYEDVKTNEKFWQGDQWGDLAEDEDLPTPVINVLQRSGTFCVASLTSNDIAVSINPFSSVEEDAERMKVFSDEIERYIEMEKVKEKSRDIVRNGYVDGSCFLMQYFDETVDTGQLVQGAIKNKIIDNTNMLFGNPYSDDIQTQPFIIVEMRQPKSQVQQEARERGLSEDEIESIKADNDRSQVNDDSDNLVTVVIKYWKEKKKIQATYGKEIVDEQGNRTIVNVPYEKTVESVWFTKCTDLVTIIKPTELGYRRYPIASFMWHKKKNSYIGISPMTSVITSQAYINKAYALCMLYSEKNAVPKEVYDEAKVDIEEIANSQFIGTSNMDMIGKFLDFIKAPDFSPQTLDTAEKMKANTKETLGVNDVQLGNVKPENTSAIIALQESSSVPLEIQKQQFYVFWEDLVRNAIDIMAYTYGERDVMTQDNGLVRNVDFGILQQLNYSINVEIGAGAQYSQIAQINTLDKYLQFGLIPGSVHAKLIPNKFLLGKNELVQAMQAAEQMQQAQAQASIGQRQLDSDKPL